MAALALLLPFGLALGALLPQLPELLRIVEQMGDALLAHPEALALALPSQGRRGCCHGNWLVSAAGGE